MYTHASALKLAPLNSTMRLAGEEHQLVVHDAARRARSASGCRRPSTRSSRSTFTGVESFARTSMMTRTGTPAWNRLMSSVV